ncbi:MAG TPA: hypothetical protein VME40_07400 [Caulobacteraceae bacterium]|nr:hypothetical protein [Caulobacteraceae bacterium]
MHKTKTWLLAGLAGAAIVGLAGMAAAQDPLHTLRVALPDGGVAVIRYAGATPPRVSFSRAPIQTSVWAPAWFGWDADAFTSLDRAAAEMNREAALMLRQAEAAPAIASLRQVDVGAPPPGVESYSLVSTASGAAVCGKSVEITSNGAGKAPRVVTRTWGDCSGAGPASPGADTVQTAPVPGAGLGGVAVYRTAYPGNG